MKKQILRLALQDITLDQRLQPRVTIHEDRVSEYAERLEAGDTFPPVTVFYDGSVYWLTDGFHRFYAARQRQETGIAAEIHDGSFHDAIEHSVSANATHGMPRSRADVRRAIETLLRDEEWGGRSDQWIASIIKCSQNTIRAERVRLESDLQIEDRSTLATRDGRTIPRTNGHRVPDPISIIDDPVPFVPNDYYEEPEPLAHAPRARFPIPVQRSQFMLAEWAELSMQDRAAALAMMHQPTTRTFNEQSGQDNIEWARWSWNPVTGCKHNCIYCYARDIANRFYEQKFEPTIIPERLAIPYHQPVPTVTAPGYKNVFTCSMADLWGRWVPQEWIDAVLQAVTDNPQWNFLMLTKFPGRMAEQEWPVNAWVGTSVDTQARVAAAEKAFRNVKAGVRWLSCEPLLEPLQFTSLDMFDWIVIGAQTRSSQAPEFQPPWEWVESLIVQARAAGCRVYLKTNVIGRPREYPE